ncbi:hypothetical protein ACIP86_15065 [Pseudomonas neuropathica]
MGQTLRDPHKSTPGSAPDDAPHHAELSPIFPSLRCVQTLCIYAKNKWGQTTFRKHSENVVFPLFILSIASSSLSECEPKLSGPIRNMAGTSAEQLLDVLRQRNGFYAFEGALHVFPSDSSQSEMGISD